MAQVIQHLVDYTGNVLCLRGLQCCCGVLRLQIEGHRLKHAADVIGVELDSCAVITLCEGVSKFTSSPRTLQMCTTFG